MGDCILKAEKVNKSFNGIKVIEDFNFTLNKGEIHGLLGGNSSGKSTFVKGLSGLYIFDSGETVLDGTAAFVHQEFSLISNFTVAENIYFGDNSDVFINKGKMLKEADKLIEAFGLKIKASAIVEDLSDSEKRIVEILRAVSKKSDILVLDEPLKGLSDEHKAFVLNLLRKLKEEGCSVIFISNSIPVVKEIADRVSVLSGGRITHTFTEPYNDENMINAMCSCESGIDYDFNKFKNKPFEAGDILLEIKNLQPEGIKKPYSAKLSRGSLTGITGFSGNPARNVLRALLCLINKQSGEIYLENSPVNAKNSDELVKCGIHLVYERDDETYEDKLKSKNYFVDSLNKLIKNLFATSASGEKIRGEDISALREKTINHLELIKTVLTENNPVTGKPYENKPKVLIMDSITKNFDEVTVKKIYDYIKDIKNEGVGIIFYSEDFDEIANLSDVIYAFKEDGDFETVQETGSVKEIYHHLI